MFFLAIIYHQIKNNTKAVQKKPIIKEVTASPK